jgi:hypothetical protein
MIARLLYTAVALCLLGTWPEHAAPVARSVEGAAPPPAATAAASAARVGPAPSHFAIPRIQR